MASSKNDDLSDVPVIYKFRDTNKKLVDAWKSNFGGFPKDRIQISWGDIFKGAPYADAIVSPANGYGFMDGGIDRAFSLHFGWQMQKRLQKVVREEHDGEILIGQSVIIPAYGEEDDGHVNEDLPNCNEGKRIKWLISAATMRVPLDVKDTAHAYLAFRGIILAVKEHNANNPEDKRIRSVLCPGLATAVGLMPPERSARQMLQAYRMFELGEIEELKNPASLEVVWSNHDSLTSDRTYRGRVVAEHMEQLDDRDAN